MDSESILRDLIMRTVSSADWVKGEVELWAPASNSLTRVKESGDQEVLQLDCPIPMALLCLFFLTHIGLLFSFRNRTLKSTRSDFLHQRAKRFSSLKSPSPNRSCLCGR